MQRSCAVVGRAAVAVAKVPAAIRAVRVLVISVSLSVGSPARAHAARTTAFLPAEPIAQGIGLSDFAPVACVRRRRARRNRRNVRGLGNDAKDGLCLCDVAAVRRQSGVAAIRAASVLLNFFTPASDSRWSSRTR